MITENAVIMASGLGTRMRPLTLTKPKPLIAVNGKPMVETVIEGLLRRNISEIRIVVGYLGEQFAYLKERYPKVHIVRNEAYETVNNISSVYAAAELLEQGNCFICEADLYLADPSVFEKDLTHSCYFGKYVSGYSDDWGFEQDKSGRITRVGKNVTDCYNMVGISYFQAEDAKLLKHAICDAYGKQGYEELFWDDVVNRNLDRLDLTVEPVQTGQIIEIDTVQELYAVEAEMSRNL